MSVVTILPDASCKHMKSNLVNTSTNSIRSMDSIYSVTPSAKFSALSRRKGIQKSRERNPMTLVPVVSEIKQRVTSARMLRMKQLQNQLGEAHHRIAELSSENRVLKSLHKRQDSALSKYESSNAELPQLLNSHAEELRMWQTRCRNLQRMNKEMATKIKQKDTIILTLTDQNKHLLLLNKDKNLLERANLQDRVKDLEVRVSDKESEIKLLARRLQLEAKSYRSNLHMEQQKYRDLLMKIEMSDFLLNRQEGNSNNNSNNNNKKPIKSAIKTNRNLSPSYRLTSKSATNLSSTVNEVTSDHQLQVPSTTVLPPCENGVKKVPESIKNNSPCVNSNVKLMPDESKDDEIDLTKNCIDKSEKLYADDLETNEDDDVTTTVKNGMNRVRRQQKAFNVSKLAPINAQNSNEKKSSDDSEFSEDDLHFFSNHNGTRMVIVSPIAVRESENAIGLYMSPLSWSNVKAPSTHQHHSSNAKDLLDHKMHINELENRMRLNSLDVKSLNQRNRNESEPSCSSPDSNIIVTTNGINTFSDRGDSEIMTIRHHDMRRESLLDNLCESLADNSSHYSTTAPSISTTTSTITRIKKLEFIGGGSPNNNIITSASNGYSNATHNGNNHLKSNGCVINGRLNEKKKTQLLAALKNIDHNGSLEN